MSLVFPRKLGMVRGQADFAKLVPDIQFNFDAIFRQAPQLLATPPAAGHIAFLVQLSDGTWDQYQIVAGPGVTLTINSVAKTLTVQSP